MDVEIRAPHERTCQLCGRSEVWDQEAENWIVDGDAVGNLHCIHAWDITGKFSPIVRESRS